ncbi:MAG: HEAT repeat domain-containing protein [Planctomycetota bacterium]
MMCVITAGLLTGCSDARKNELVVKLFEPKRSPSQNMVAAFAAEDPDVRRAALAKVAQSKDYDRDWAIKGYVAIALLDDNEQARCVALRALARTGDARASETALKLLDYQNHPPAEIRPPGALTRWDAAEALARLSAAEQVPPEPRQQVREILGDRLRADVNRHVRIAAARGLGYYPEAETVPALIAGLNDEDFAVAHQCEESLVRLTGYTHNCNALEWENWLTEHESDLFARAGQIPESRRLPYHNRLEKVGYDFKQFVRWLVPESKDK